MWQIRPSIGQGFVLNWLKDSSAWKKWRWWWRALAVRERMLGDFNSQAIANIAWAFDSQTFKATSRLRQWRQEKNKKCFLPNNIFPRSVFPKPICSKIGYATTDRGQIGLEKPFLQDRFFQNRYFPTLVFQNFFFFQNRFFTNRFLSNKGFSQTDFFQKNQPKSAKHLPTVGQNRQNRPRISLKSANIGKNRQPHSQNRSKISQMHWPVIGHPLAIHWLPFAIHWPSIGLRSPSIGQPVAFIRHLLAIEFFQHRFFQNRCFPKSVFPKSIFSKKN